MKKEKLQYERVTVLQQVEVLLENPIVDSGASGGESYDPSADVLSAFGPHDDGSGTSAPAGTPNIDWID